MQLVPAIPSATFVGSAAPNLVFDGDSISVIGVEGQALGVSTFGNGYPAQTIEGIDQRATLANVAVAGETVATMTANAAANIDPLYNSTLKSAVLMFGGTNDLGQAPFQSAATTYARIVAYHQARRAVGWKTVVFTIMPRTSGGTPGTFEADRLTVNANIRANWATFADALADIGADAIMGTVANTTDTRYFADQLHPTPAGSRIIARYAKAALATLGIITTQRPQTDDLVSNVIGLHCLGIGLGALSANTTGQDNTALGEGALASNTTTNSSTAVGYNALNAATIGNNTAVGWGALQNDTTGTQNTAIGIGALRTNLTGNQQTAVGYAALNAATAGNSTAVGYGALAANTTSTSVAVGANALAANTTSTCTAVGTNALLVSTGTSNTAVGHNALQANTTAASNTAIGHGSMFNATTGGNNTAIGFNALVAVTTGTNNVGIGLQAGYTATPANATVAGHDNTFLGYNSGPGSAADPSYAVAIGSGALVSASGGVAIGVDHTGAAASSPTQDLIVLGTANHTTRIPGLPAFVAADKYLVVDASGNIHKSAIGPAS